jgi:hypothetical protein
MDGLVLGTSWLHCLATIILYGFFSCFKDEKYLGYILNPRGYGKSDWGWILEKVDCHINVWCNIWLSIGGSLTWLKLVLEAIHFLAHNSPHS